jgi:hypothetical protein
MYINSNYGGSVSSDLVVMDLLIAHVEPLLWKYRVNVAFWGHNHVYQRHAAVLNKKTIQKSTSFKDADGNDSAMQNNPQATVHFVVGTGGASFTKNAVSPYPEWCEKVFYQYGYVKMSAVNASYLEWWWIDNSDNKVYDHVVVTQSDSTAEPSSAPTWSMHPSEQPSCDPTASPSSSPSVSPSAEPSSAPTWSMHPSEQPSCDPTASPSMFPSLESTVTVIDASNDVFLSIKLHKFRELDLVAVAVVCSGIGALILWLGVRRDVEVIRCSKENLGKNTGRRGPPQKLMDFTAFTHVKSWLSYCSLVFNASQIGQLVLDGYVWNAYVIVLAYLVAILISAAVQFMLFQITCFTNLTDLPLRLYRKSLSRNKLLWPLVAWLSLFDMLFLAYFPWIDNDFCRRSEGFPSLRLFVLVHSVILMKNVVITIAMATTESLNLLQFLSLCFSVSLILLSMFTLCIKVLYEKLYLYEVVVVSKEFAERVGITLPSTMIVDMESDINPTGSRPIDLEAAAGEQQQITAALDDLVKRRDSRLASQSGSRSLSETTAEETKGSNVTENPYADKTIEVLKLVINDCGGKPIEYIPLAIIRAELGQLMQTARDGAPFDEDRLDYLIRCMEYNDEYIAQKKEEEQKWVEDTREVLSKCLEAMRPFIPVNIASMTLQDLESAGLSKGLAKRIMTKRCLWLIRMNQSDIAKMHVADLTSKYSPEAQNLDVIEMAAIYHWLLGVKFESDAGGRKVKMRDGLKRTLKEKMGAVTSYEDLVKKRNIAYKNQAGPFTDLDAVYTLDVVSTENVFLPKLSIRGLTRPAFDAAARAILETKSRSDNVGDAWPAGGEAAGDSQA